MIREAGFETTHYRTLSLNVLMNNSPDKRSTIPSSHKKAKGALVSEDALHI
ncbi:MAG TPA: hypothetical protein VJ281_00470 [Chthoniobacterales bacterium]|nr:hypothetical protein [Chthoniobacterales bacterium]